MLDEKAEAEPEIEKDGEKEDKKEEEKPESESKEEAKESNKMLPFHKLFSFSSCCDKTLVFMGIILAIVGGALH